MVVVCVLVEGVQPIKSVRDNRTPKVGVGLKEAVKEAVKDGMRNKVRQCCANVRFTNAGELGER